VSRRVDDRAASVAGVAFAWLAFRRFARGPEKASTFQSTRPSPALKQ
jgi:hypothetical protein